MGAKLWVILNLPLYSTVADRFPRGDAKGANLLLTILFSKKLHENGEIWGQRGGARLLRYYFHLDPPLYGKSVVITGSLANQ